MFFRLYEIEQLFKSQLPILLTINHFHLDTNLNCIEMQLLEKIGPATVELKGKGIDFSLWYKPDDYITEV